MEEFEFLDDLATADVAIEARGDTLEELFGASATATFEVMVNTKGVKPRTKKVLCLENQEIDTLLFDWLSELIYLKDAEYMVFSSFNIQIRKDLNYVLQAQIFVLIIPRQMLLLAGQQVVIIPLHLRGLRSMLLPV